MGLMDDRPSEPKPRIITSVEYFNSRGFSEGLDVLTHDTVALRDRFLLRLRNWKVPFQVIHSTEPLVKELESNGRP